MMLSSLLHQAIAPSLALIPGPSELWIILAVVVLFFGGRKLPALARAMGSSITQFKRGLKDDDPDQLEEGGDKEEAQD